MYPTIPCDYKQLKNACRKGLSPESRQLWWPLLSQVAKGKNVTEAGDVEKTAGRLLSLLNEYFAGGSGFEWKTEVLVRALVKRKNSQCPELFNRLVRIVAESLPQIEICFLVCCDLLNEPDRLVNLYYYKYNILNYNTYLSILFTYTQLHIHRYLEATALAHGCRLYTFVEVLKRYLPKTTAILDEIGALQPPFLNLMFVDFFR